MPSPSNTSRTQVRRKPQRAHHEAATIRAIIDEALVCQIAFNQGGSVHCLPMACWREGDFLYIHGANNSRLTQTLLEHECAVSITHLDGLVLARSAFHHSMNYRSVAIYGRFEAEDQLRGFLIGCQMRGLRSVLVITGQGRRGGGIIRSSVHDWLTGPHLRGVVSGFASAHRRHGGDGALYVTLKPR